MLGYTKPTRFRQNLSYNFHLLCMPRDMRSFHGLKHVVDRDKSGLFHMFIREDRKSFIFQEKSCFSSSKTIEILDRLSTD